MKVVTRNSPNQSTRHGDVRLIVCHTPEHDSYTAMQSFLTSPSAGVSYHLLIRADGQEATQLVPWNRKAWHAKELNSLSDGISLMGRARHFDVDSAGAHAFARVVAQRLHARGLQPQWTTDVAKGGFCRHGDLQSDRSDPTPDLAEWRVFVGMVQAEYRKLTSGDRNPHSKGWPVPVPAWFWRWAKWRLQGRPGTRPADAPLIIPAWAWRRLVALQAARKA